MLIRWINDPRVYLEHKNINKIIKALINTLKYKINGERHKFAMRKKKIFNRLKIKSS